MIRNSILSITCLVVLMTGAIAASTAGSVSSGVMPQQTPTPKPSPTAEPTPCPSPPDPEKPCPTPSPMPSPTPGG